MSWMKRAQTSGPPTSGSEQPPYSASQNPYLNQQNVYQNYTTNASTTPNPQQYWQMQTPQQYDNANQLYQQNNQNVSTPQAGYHQNYSLFNQNQSTNQHNFMQNQQNADNWQDNWDWGWDESAKQAPNSTQQTPGVMSTFMPQQQSYNNANVIEESFTANDTWNWSMNEKKEDSHVVAGRSEETGTVTEQQEFNNQASGLDSCLHSGSVIDRTTVNQPTQTVVSAESQVNTLNDRDVIKEKMPNLALGKRIHLDNLTPQWSIESQMSQESSDGPATQSETTYRSENQSRNSNKSSPGLNTDNLNYLPSNIDDTFSQDLLNSKNTRGDTIKKNDIFSTDRVEVQNNSEDLAVSLKELNLTNRENVTPDSINSLATSTHNPQEDSCNTAANVVLAASSGSMPPSSNFPPITASQNPFKHSGAFSHKNIIKGSASNTAPVSQPSISTFPKDINDLSSNTNLTPSLINKLSHQRNRVTSYYQTANLETTPDNSERPDHPQVPNYRSMAMPPTVPENLEVAPRNDRNEYLQTAHLSSGDYGENTDFTREAPPLGLRRMVVGQHEGEYGQILNLTSDEPPPGLSRMVPGQQNESENTYSQPNDDYLGRRIDGQPTDASSRLPYRQADGQQIHNNYISNTTSKNTERRPIGLDRMVPGEPSLEDYSRVQQYQNSNYSSSSEHRIVTGVDYDYQQMPQECNPSEVREQNVDGSEYMEDVARGVPRNIVGALDVSAEAPIDYNLHSAPTVPDLDETRELTVEGENLQDLSIISSVELSFSRDQPLDGADLNTTDLGMDRKTDISDSIDLPTINSRRQSLNRTNTSGEDSERNKAFKVSPKRERDKHKSSRDNDLRHSRDERKYERDSDRRSGRDRDRRNEKERRDKDRERRDYKDVAASPEGKRYRRINKSHRYETEDTDYYSDRERERRRYREGSYTSSKPPRPDDKDRRYREDKDRNRRYATIERERRYDPESERYGSSRRRSDRERGEIDRKYDDRKYRDIDPDRKYGNLRREKEERRRAGERELGEDERDEGRADERARRRHRRDRHYDPYYDGYEAAYSDPYMLQRQQQQTFQYYEQLRLSNPAAYMEIYKKLMAGHPLPPAGPLITSIAELDPSRGASYLEGYGGAGYEVRGEERGSVHSGRSSANPLTGKDTPRMRYYGAYRGGAVDAGSVRDAYSLRTDLSDRDFTTDASLNLQLEESVRSERMTPLKFATAHVKGSLSSRHLVVVRASYGRALDGRPAAVHVLRLSAALADDPQARELDAYPGPLITGVTHKKSVIEYCEAHIRTAERRAAHDLFGYVLIWELLALLLRQNGTVVGSDIAELLMKNAREYEYRSYAEPLRESDSRGSAVSSSASRLEPRPPHDLDDGLASAAGPFAAPFDAAPPSSFTECTAEEPEGGGDVATIDSTEKIDKLRELLIYGNRQQALEWAMSSELWGHALHLAAWSDRRTRAAVAARFVAAQPPSDPLHTLYAALAGRQPPVANCAADARWADWRPHLAVLLANPTAKPEQDKRTITQLGDSLMSRGLSYSAQFCYLTAGVEWSRHPMAPLAPVSSSPSHATQPPRLTLLLAPTNATKLQQFASNPAIFATEIYEYARSLHDPDYTIVEFQVYKLVAASRLADCGRDGRALTYAEAAARAVSRAPHLYSPRFIAQLAEFADKLKYHEEGVQEAAVLDEEGAESESSPRHMRWLQELQALAHAHSHASTPTHQPVPMQEPGAMPAAEAAPAPVPLYWTTDQIAAQQQQPLQPLTSETANYIAEPLTATAPAPHREQAYDYGAQYYTHSAEEGASYAAHDWGHVESTAPPAPPAPPPDLDDRPDPYGYRQAEEARPQITMPGAVGGGGRAALFHDYDDTLGHNHDSFVPDAAQTQERETDSPSKRGLSKKEDSSKRKEDNAKGGNGKSGWLGGILTKLSLRPPNQMILPDDKNPRIVWDDENKRWTDLDRGGDEDTAPPPPPPAPLVRAAAADLSTGGPPQPAAAAAPTANIFKMQKSRHIKKSYVDVFNPSGAPTRPLPPAAEVLGPAPPAPVSAPAYFVPAPTSPQ